MELHYSAAYQLFRLVESSHEAIRVQLERVVFSQNILASKCNCELPLCFNIIIIIWNAKLKIQFKLCSLKLVSFVNSSNPLKILNLALYSIFFPGVINPSFKLKPWPTSVHIYRAIRYFLAFSKSPRPRLPQLSVFCGIEALTHLSSCLFYSQLLLLKFV